MKKITIVTLGLMLLALWSGGALAANPPSKTLLTQFSQIFGPGTPQQPGPWAQTTPGIAVRGAFVDLAVTEISVQELGQGALIRVTVKNLGTATADANLYRLRVLQDGAPLPGGDQPLFNARSPIGPNQARVTGIIPTKSGRTRVTATLIPRGAASSDNPANNSLELTLNLPEVLPDFTIVNLSLTGDNLVRITIRNQGGYPARDARGKLDVYVGNDRVDSIAVSQWPNPGETKGITSTARIAGRQSVRATINPDRAVREANPGNNTLARELTAHAFKPDLIVKNLDRWKQLPSKQNLTAVTKLVIVVANIGRAPSPPMIRADVFRGGRILETLTLQGPIANGTEKRFETGIRIEGVSEYRVTVDPLNAIDEEREDNNSRAETLRGFTSGELHPVAISYYSGIIVVNHPNGSMFPGVPCSGDWPFVRVRVKGELQYALPTVGGAFSKGDDKKSDAEGPTPILINDRNLNPYQRAGNVYDYMLRCTGPLNLKISVSDSNYSDNEQSRSDPLSAEIFIPSGGDVRRSGLPMP